MLTRSLDENLEVTELWEKELWHRDPEMSFLASPAEVTTKEREKGSRTISVV
jgi:hypothetical protein